MSDAERKPDAVQTLLALAALGLDDLDRQAIDALEVWVHDYANDKWRALTAAEQLAVARAIVLAALTPPEDET